MNTVPNDDEQLRTAVSERYARVALEVLGTGEASTDACCSGSPGSSCCSTGSSCGDAITSDLYSGVEIGDLPVAAALASLGCGNPTALAELKPGEKVLDLGSGGGIDVLLSARRVGPTGFAYGLDMTDAMLELAERNRIEKARCCAKPTACLAQEAVLPSQISSSRAKYRRPSVVTLRHGQAVSREHWKKTPIGVCWPKLASPI